MAIDMISGAITGEPNAETTNNLGDLYWTEKYRGDLIETTDLKRLIVLPTGLKNTIKNAITMGGIGNYIFHSGHPGTGKSSLARAIPGMLGARSVWVPPKSSGEILDLINRYSTMKTNGRPYFFVIDECDHPNNPEDFWRGIQAEVEATASRLRFIMTCNELWRVPKAVQSRCYPIKFDHPVQDREFKLQILNKLMFIAQEETKGHGGQVEKNTICEIARACYPDIRLMISTMQNTFYENNGNIVGVPRVITDQMIEIIAGYLVTRDSRGLRYYISQNVDNHLGVYIPLTRYLMDRLPPSMDFALFKLTRDGLRDSQGQVDQESMLMGFLADLVDVRNAFQIPSAPLPKQPVNSPPQAPGVPGGDNGQ